MASGTASGGGVDYDFAPTTISIPAGSTTGTTVITVVDDALDETDETVVLAMQTPTNATLGTPATYTLTITDNDAAPTVAFTTAAQTVDEAVGSVTVTAQLDAVSGLDVTVAVAASGTATGGGVDYDYAPTTI